LENLITTKFETDNYEELFKLAWEFEDKLTVFCKNNKARWGMEIHFGPKFHFIYLYVTTDEDKN
tara:strand:- start:2378 stop:2569 length:192 start_codon:yes stop_codon:yes gene_type:complete